MAKGLPRRLRAAICVVVHSAPDMPSALPELLSRGGPLPARHAEDRERVRHGHIYIAPPDHHLLLGDRLLRVTQGPRENGFRPAVDPLFRTAAQHHGSRVVGIVLSGALDDGTRGLQQIKRAGGVAIVQHVEDAAVSGMPLSAIRNVEVDYILPAAEIAAVVTRLATEPVAPSRPAARSKRRGASPDVAEKGRRHLAQQEPRGTLVPFTCPECGGSLWLSDRDGVTTFRCHVGHDYSAESLGAGINERLEQALWTALRTLEESAALQQQLARRARDHGLRGLAAGHDARAGEAARRAAVIKRELTSTAWVRGRRLAPRRRRRAGEERG